jgi:hypothetical protein
LPTGNPAMNCDRFFADALLRVREEQRYRV